MELIAAFAGEAPFTSKWHGIGRLHDLTAPTERREEFMPDPHPPDYDAVTDAIITGSLVYFFGTGVNLCDRPLGVRWSIAEPCLPDGSELAQYLAERFTYPSTEFEANCPHCSEPVRVTAKAQDLARVSQYVDIMRGNARLYEELHQIFDRDYPLTPLHRFIATLPSVLRGRGLPSHQVIITTNYDDLLERAFIEVGEPFDRLSYEAVGTNRGKFLHYRWLEPEATLIERPNEYAKLKLNERSLIVKIHGAVKRKRDAADDSYVSAEDDSYVITEDDYINFPSHATISSFVPVTLAEKMRRSHFLFLGYSLRDWNLRVFLNRIWRERKLRYQSWAIQLDPETLDEEFWRGHDVKIYNARLDEFIVQLDEHLRSDSGE